MVVLSAINRTESAINRTTRRDIETAKSGYVQEMEHEEREAVQILN